GGGGRAMWGMPRPRGTSGPAIVAGLVVEYVVLRFAFKLGAPRAAAAVVVMNIISAGIGLVLSPLWHPSLGVYHGHPIAQVHFVFLPAVLISTLSEQAVLRLGFRVPYTWRGFGWLLAANATTAGIAMLAQMAGVDLVQARGAGV